MSEENRLGYEKKRKEERTIVADASRVANVSPQHFACCCARTGQAAQVSRLGDSRRELGVALLLQLWRRTEGTRPTCIAMLHAKQR